MVRRCVWSRILVNKEALAHWGGGGAVAPKTNKWTNKEWEEVYLYSAYKPSQRAQGLLYLASAQTTIQIGRRYMVTVQDFPTQICKTQYL